jgi:hypothetical protein
VRVLEMSTQTIVIVWIAMLIIGWLAGVEWWMIVIGAVVGFVGYLLERRRD